MKIKYLILISILMLVLNGCNPALDNQHNKLVNADFEVPPESNQSPVGWETVINDGYAISSGDGITKGGQALVLDGRDTGKAALMAQKVNFDEPTSMRFNLSGYIKTEELSGESSMYVRAYAGSQLIYQDDMKAYALSGDNDWTTMKINTPWLIDVTVLEIGVLALGAGQVWFDEVELKSSLNQSISTIALQFGQQALALISEHGYYPVDDAVAAHFHESMKGAQSVEDVYGSVVMLLSKLGDKHASFVPAQKVNQVFNKSTEPERETSIRDLPSSFNKLEHVGYIKIPGFNKKAGDAQAYINAAYQVYLDNYESAECGWVVDLTRNSGGSMWPMLAALSPFFDEGILGYMKVSSNEKIGWKIENREVLLGEKVKQQIPFDPSQLRQTIFGEEYSQTLGVLIDANTASSAEAVAISLMSNANVLFFGGQSSGFTTGISQLELSDGSVVNLSMAAFLDHQGNEYDEGVKPDVDTGRHQVLEAAYRYLIKQDNCSKTLKALKED